LPARDRAKIPETHGFEALTVWENLEIAMKTDKSVWASLRAKLSGEQRDRIDEMLVLLRLSSERDRRAGCFRTGKSSFWRSVCCWYRIRICFCWMNLPPG
jgi:ABC-type uncharacterized transport system ATPase subunit